MPDYLHCHLLPRLAQLYQESELLIALFDDNDDLQFANPAFRHAYNLTEHAMPNWAQMMRDNYASRRGTIVKTDNFENWLCSTLSRRGKQRYRVLETDLHDGRWLLMTETVDTAGWMLCTAVDVSELATRGRSLRTARDQALRAASTDELTGLSNRRHILAQLEELLARPGKHSIAILDIDHFKQINDHHGHPVGDIVLIDFGRQLRNTLRRSDGVGRLGGEEFMLILPDTSLAQAASILENLLAVHQHPRPLGEQLALSYQFSGGLTSVLAGDTLQSAYQRADNALYCAKRNGRNRIEHT